MEERKRVGGAVVDLRRHPRQFAAAQCSKIFKKSVSRKKYFAISVSGTIEILHHFFRETDF